MSVKPSGIHFILDDKSSEFLDDLRGVLRPIPSKTRMVSMMVEYCRSQDRDTLLAALSVMAQQDR